MKLDDDRNTDASSGYTPNEQSENTGASTQCTVESTQNEQPKTTGVSNQCTAESIQHVQGELIENLVASNPVTVNFTDSNMVEKELCKI